MQFLMVEFSRLEQTLLFTDYFVEDFYTHTSHGD